MNALERGGRLFGSADQTETNSVNGEDGWEKQSQQKKGNEDLG
jgi:hypothetical protein